jgi:hypothetical protein
LLDDGVGLVTSRLGLWCIGFISVGSHVLLNSRSPPLLLCWVFSVYVALGTVSRNVDKGSPVGCCVPFEGLTWGGPLTERGDELFVYYVSY